MQSWEIVVIVLGVVIVGVSVYLVLTLKKLNALVAKLDSLVSTNTASVTSIVNNVDGITADTKKTVKTLSDAVNNSELLSSEKKKSEGGDENIYGAIKSVVSTAGFAYGVFKYLSQRKKDRRINKIYKDMKRRNN